jgi:hypothetical protein
MKFMNSVLKESSCHCFGEKSLFNWVLKIDPHNLRSKLRLASYEPELFIYLLQNEKFLSRFLYWYHDHKQRIESWETPLPNVKHKLKLYTEFIDPLIGMSLIYVSECHFDSNVEIPLWQPAFEVDILRTQAESAQFFANWRPVHQWGARGVTPTHT